VSEAAARAVGGFLGGPGALPSWVEGELVVCLLLRAQVVDDEGVGAYPCALQS
jgi:hypothetical protein